MIDRWTNNMGETVVLTDSGDLRVHGQKRVTVEGVLAVHAQREKSAAFLEPVPYFEKGKARQAAKVDDGGLFAPVVPYHEK